MLHSRIRLAVAGTLLGALIGFLLRPSALFVGQLPFQVVVTRGAMLSGLDQLLVPAAQASFNMMFVGTVLGALGGLGVKRLLGRADPASLE